MSDIVINTSAAGTSTIEYVATDNAGNVATSTRTVIVASPATAPAIEDLQDDPQTEVPSAPEVVEEEGQRATIAP